MNEQPEALRLADGLKHRSDWYEFDPSAWCPDASAELRRLHALCEEMGGALDAFRTANGANDFNGWHSRFDDAIFKARIALAKWRESK